MDGLEMWATRCGNPCGTWDTPEKDYSQCDSGTEVDFTGVNIVGCNQAYITTSNGNIIYCSNLSSLITSGTTSTCRIIKGGSVCPSDTTPLNCVAVVDNKWLLIGGNNGLFEISNFPQNTSSTCTTFTPCSFGDGTVPTGSINAIKQIDTNQIVAVGSNGQVFYSPDTTSPPVFTNAHAGVPSSETLYAVDGTDLADIVFSGNNGQVYTFNETTDTLSTQTVMSNDKGLAITRNANGQCGIVVIANQFNPCPAPPFTPTPSPTPTKTSTPTPTPTRTKTLTPTPTPSPTPTKSPTLTSTHTLTFTSTFSPTFTLTFSPTPTCVVQIQASTPVNQTVPAGSPVTVFSFTITGNCPGSITLNFPFTCTGNVCSNITGWEIYGPVGENGFFTGGVITATGLTEGTYQFVLGLGPGANGTIQGGISGGTGPGGITGLPISEGVVTVTGTPSYEQSVCVGPSEWFVGNGGLEMVTQTGNGPVSQQVPVIINGATVTGFSSLYSCSSNILWAVGANGTVVWTTNGGTSWQEVNWASLGIPQAASDYFQYVTSNNNCSSIQILASNGDIVTLNLSGSGTAVTSGTYTSLPAGLVAFPGQAQKLIVAINPATSKTERWVIGQNGLILHDPGTGVFTAESLSSVSILGGTGNVNFSGSDITSLYVDPSNFDDIWAVGSSAAGDDVVLHSVDDSTWQTFSPLLNIGSVLGTPIGAINLTSVKEGVNNDLIMTGSNGYYIDLNMLGATMTSNPSVLAALQKTTQEYDIIQVNPGTILIGSCGCVVCDWQATVYNITDTFQNCGATPSPTPGNSSTNTPTNTPTPTISPTGTPSLNATATAVGTLTAAATSTSIAAQTETAVATVTAAATSTSIEAQTQTAVDTLTAAATSTSIAAQTETAVATVTAAATSTSIEAQTQTAVDTLTVAATSTFIEAQTETAVATLTAAATSTSIAAQTQTAVATLTVVGTITVQPNQSPTFTPAPSMTPNCVQFVLKWGSLGSGNGQFNTPGGVATDNLGHVFVQDFSNSRIEEFDTSGNYITQFGSAGSGNGQFEAGDNFRVPSIAANGNGVYALDTLNGRVELFASSGAFVTAFGSDGSGNGQLVNPTAIALDVSGNVYVADTGNSRVEEFTSTGAFVMVFGSNGSGNGQFSDPQGIAVDSFGNIFVSDTGNSRIEKFTSAGVYITQWGTAGSGNGQFSQVAGLAVDPANNVYAADPGNDRIQIFDDNGNFISKFGSLGADAAQFNYPTGVSVDNQFNIYVADGQNNRVQKFSDCPPLPPQCCPSFAFQWGGIQGTGNGQFSIDYDLAIDGQGNVYVADTDNSRIQVFGPTGNYITQWPTANQDFAIAVNQAGTTVYAAENSEVQAFSYNGTTGTLITSWSTGVGGGAFTGLRGVALDSLGNVYTAEAKRVQKFTSTGSYILSWTGDGGSDSFASLSAIAVGPGNYVYVTDGNGSGFGVVEKFDSSGNLITSWNDILINGESLGPVGLATDPSTGDVYVADGQQHLIEKFSPNGQFICSFGLPQNLSEIMGLGIGPNGDIYVADAFNNRVVVFACVTGSVTPTPSPTPSPTQTTTPTSACCYQLSLSWTPIPTVGPFNGPFGVCAGTVSGSTTIFVADTSNSRVLVFDESGDFISQFGSFGNGNGLFMAPWGIAEDSSGNVYVADDATNLISKFTYNSGTNNYVYSGLQWGDAGIGNTGSESLFNVAVDPSGNVYALGNITTGTVVQKFNSSGTLLATLSPGSLGQPLGQPYGLAVDSNYVYVAGRGTGSNFIQRYDLNLDASSQLVWGGTGTAPGQFNTPWGVSTDSSGNVYVADQDNARFQVFNSNGVFLCQTSLNNETYQGIAVDPTGNVYLTSANNPSSAVYKYSPCSKGSSTPTPTTTNTVTITPTSTGTPNSTSTPACSTAWTETTASAGFCRQSGLGSDVMVDPADSTQKLWVVGETNNCSSSPTMEIWNTLNGSAWSLVADPSNVPARTTFSTVVMPDPNAGGTLKMWVIGGYQGASTFDDVWSSPNGITWTEMTSAMGIGGPHFHTSVVMTDPADGVLKMWVIGGQLGTAIDYSNQVWCSPDGVHWTQKTEVTSFPGRTGHSSVVMTDPADGVTKMWVIGGQGTPTGLFNDVWCSPDGVNWTEKTSNAAFYPRTGQSSVLCGNDIWVIGGIGGPTGILNDAWVSTDGIHWSLVAPSGPVFLARYNQTSSVFQNNVYVIAGLNDQEGPDNLGDVWETSCTTCGSLVTTSMVRGKSGAGLRTTTPTPTPSPTMTPTPTITPTPAIQNVSVVAAPNISRNGQVIQFEVALPKASQVHLALYSISDELVYQTTFQGNTGVNNLAWPLKNQSGNSVASGLYIYTVEANNGTSLVRQTGKLVVMH